jgi:hypothetical protein
MKLEEWAEAIQPELRAWQGPPPRAELLERILTSRARGARVVLPDVAERPPRSWARVMIPAALAAMLLLLAIPFVHSPDSLIGDERAATEWIPMPVALAQTTVSRAPVIELAQVDRLRPLTLEYARSWRDSRQQEVARTQTVVTLQQRTSEGTPAWLLVSRSSGVRGGRELVSLDSVTVARSDLRLLRRTALVAPYSRYDDIRITQLFRGDSVRGQMIATRAGTAAAQRPIARTMRPESQPYIAGAFGPVLLGSLELHAGWRGRASLVGWAVRDDDVSMPIELRVVGEGVVTVPAGRFDCWHLEIHYRGRALLYWARKSDGVGVRSVEREASGVTRETVLVKAAVGVV